VLAQIVDIRIGQPVRFECELPGEGERSALRRGELRPVTVQGGDFVFS
jgi:hypothetical protein